VRVSLFVPCFVDQLTPQVGLAAAKVSKRLGHQVARHGNQMPSMLSFFTGPSRTGDIERILVLGAYGPKELYLILIG